MFIVTYVIIIESTDMTLNCILRAPSDIYTISHDSIIFELFIYFYVLYSTLYNS